MKSLLTACTLLGVLAGSNPANASTTWEYVESMAVERSAAVSVALDSQWYIVGGRGPAEIGFTNLPTSTESFDFEQGTRADLPGVLGGRIYSAMVADLDHRRFFLVGGKSATLDGSLLTVAWTDIWDGLRWSRIEMNAARYMHAVAFAAGTVIATGGFGGIYGEEERKDAEILRSPEEGWLRIGDMPQGNRFNHTMTTLSDDRHVLVVGGCGFAPSGIGSGGQKTDSSVDLYDANSYAWRASTPMNKGHCGHRAARMSDGRVIVAGGKDPSVEIFDPATETWTLAAPLLRARIGHAIFALPDNRVVVAGGTDNFVDADLGTLRSAEIYDPELDQWTSLPDMLQSRWTATGAVFGSTIYMAGGYDGNVIVKTVERLTIPPKASPGPQGEPERSVDTAEPSGGACAVPPRTGGSRFGAATIAGLLVMVFGLRRRSAAA